MLPEALCRGQPGRAPCAIPTCRTSPIGPAGPTRPQGRPAPCAPWAKAKAHRELTGPEGHHLPAQSQAQVLHCSRSWEGGGETSDSSASLLSTQQVLTCLGFSLQY